MDPVNQEAIKASAFTLLGYVWQWARAHKAIPDWLSWVAVGSACVAAYVWATPGWQYADWRGTLLSLYGFVLAARGAASTSKDVLLAPPANTK